MKPRYNATWTVIVERSHSALKARWRKDEKKCAYCGSGDDYLHAFGCAVPQARHILDMQAWIERLEDRLMKINADSETSLKIARSDFCRMQLDKRDR